MVNASDLKSDEQKMFLSVRSRSGVQLTKSPLRKHRPVKGSGFYLLSNNLFVISFYKRREPYTLQA